MNGITNTLEGFAKTLKQIPVIIALALALVLGGISAVLVGTAAGAIGYLITRLILRGLAVVMKKWIKPETPEGKRRLLATILAIPLMIVIMCVPIFGLKLFAAYLVPALMTAQSFSYSTLLGVFVSLSSIKHA